MAAPLWGQAADSPIVFDSQEGVKTSFEPTPANLSANSSTSSSTSDDFQWLKVEFHYSVKAPKATPNATFVDAVEFRVWVEGRDLLAPDAPGREGVAVALTGNVTYVNIPVGKDQFGVFYIHPSSLVRYSTSSGKSDFDRKFNVHVEAYVGGQKMDYIDKKKEPDPDWASKLRAIPGLVYRQNQCPFILTDADRYPAMKIIDDSGSSASAPAPVSAPAAPSAP